MCDATRQLVVRGDGENQRESWQDKGPLAHARSHGMRRSSYGVKAPGDGMGGLSAWRSGTHLIDDDGLVQVEDHAGDRGQRCKLGEIDGRRGAMQANARELLRIVRIGGVICELGVV